MTNEQVMKQLNFVVYGEDLNRVHVTHDNNGQMIIKFDAHEMKCRTANKVFNNIICMFRCPFTLDVIHGYNHGTAIKDMIQNDMNNQRIVSKEVATYNPGETFIKVA